MRHTDNQRLIKDFKHYLEVSVTTTNYSGYSQYSSGYKFYPPSHSSLVIQNSNHDDFKEYGNNPMNYLDKGNIFFYEWSSMNKGCRHYNSISEFFKFLGECGIKISDENRRIVKIGTCVWLTCRPNKKEAVLRKSRMDLGRFLSDENNDSLSAEPQAKFY